MYLKVIINKARLNGIPIYCFVLLITYLVVKYYSSTFRRSYIPVHLHKYLNFSESFKVSSVQLLPRDLNIAATTVELVNYEREVFNEERFGKVTPETTILLIQVHCDIERLQYLIVSLAQVHYIETTLLVFSHSYFDETINNMIMKIRFCRFMQIFYPFSVQLNPKKFPGIDPEDCLSLQTPIQYCSNRDARRTEYKHHWWWKAYFVFNNLDWSDKYRGTVVFLDESNYVLPDLLYMLRYSKRSLSVITGISVMVFGRPYFNNLDYDLLVIDTWRPPYDNGLAFNITVWKEIAALSSYFCTYDDLSWSYSLLNLFSRFRGGHVDMVSTMAPRVLTTSLYSTGREAVEKIHTQVKGAPYFPLTVKAALVYSSTGRVDSGVNLPSKGTGGWSDLRDHLLCLDPLSTADQTTDATADDTTTTPKFVILPQINYSSAVIVVEDTTKRRRARNI